MGKNDYKGVDIFENEWNNPPPPFNPLYDGEAAKQRRKNEAFIKNALDEYHKRLKHLSNDDYYDLMDKKEKELRTKLKNKLTNKFYTV